MNRYTNLTPATFNPLSLEEIMMVPIMKQKQHDASLQAAAEMDQFDVNRLNVDDELVRTEADKIRQQLTGIQDELYKTGFNKGITRKLLETKKARDKFLSPSGTGGMAQNAYMAFHQNVKDIMDNDNMNPDDKQEAIMYARRQYEQSGGLAKKASYNPYMGFNSVNLNEKLMTYGKELEPFIQKTSGWRKDPNDDTMWTNGTEKTTELPLEVIQSALTMAAMGDGDIKSYLREKSRINPGFDPRQALMSSIQGVSPLFIRNDYEYDHDIKFDTRKKETDGNGVYSFDSSVTAVPSLKEAYDMELFDNYDAPLPSASKSEFVKRSEKVSPYGTTFSDLADSQVPKPGEKALAIQEEVGKWLIGDSFSMKNPGHRAKVRTYLESMGPHMGNQSINIIDPTAINIAGVAEGNSKDHSKFEESVNDQFLSKGTKFMANGKFYNDRGLLLADLGMDEDTKKVDIAEGVVDWDNNLHMNLPKGAEKWKGDFTEPLAFSLVVGKNTIPVYMTRKDGDIGRSPALKKARIDLNDKVSKMKVIPMRPVEIELLDENDEPATVKMAWIPTEEGGVFRYELDGETQYMTKQGLQDNKYELETKRSKQAWQK